MNTATANKATSTTAGRRTIGGQAFFRDWRTLLVIRGLPPRDPMCSVVK
jgi:hypothetical protein